MGLTKRLLLTFAAQFCIFSCAYAQERGTAVEAKALAERGIAQIKSAGLEKSLEAFTSNADGKWKLKDIYVFVLSFDGQMLAHGANKALVGKNMSGMKDANGKNFNQEMIDVAKSKGTGLVDYMWTDPVSKKLAEKSAYIVRIPGADALLGVGIYK